MAKLLVKYGERRDGKNTPFHPSMRIESTGYSEHQWTVLHFIDGCRVGHGAVNEYDSVKDAVEDYFADLRRMKYKQVEEQPHERT